MVGFGMLSTPGYVENAYELLDQPGEFYLDATVHRIYYIPRPGENMHTADVEAPQLQLLVGGHGTADSPVHDIVFSGLQFSYATWLQPGTRDGFSEEQANYTITGNHGYDTEGICHVAPHGTCPYGAWTKEPGNVQFSDNRNLSFIGDQFLHLGAAGLNLDNGSQNVTVMDSVFTDISGNGLEIGSVNKPMASGPSQTIGVRVLDCHLFGLPVEYHGGVAILVGYAADTLIAHNQIDHTPYAAISIGWGGWLGKMNLPPVPNFSHDNVVSNNLVYDFMQTLLDGGGIYTQGMTGSSMANGEKVIGNVVHDQLDWGYAMHSDDGATYVSYIGNVLYDNSYDFGSNHVDFRPKSRGTYKPITYDPQTVVNNFWQQGYPNTSQPKLKVTASRNKIISGPRDVPASILSQAGIEPKFRSILAWHQSDEAVPGPPSSARALYGFRGTIYVGWHPGVGLGKTPVRSYTVMPCLVGGRDACGGTLTRSVTITASEFRRLGYAVVPGFPRGRHYTFQVRANSAAGSSAPSIPTDPVAASQYVPRPSRPLKVSVVTGPRLVRLLWYAPSSSGAWPVLAYVVKSSAGQKWTFTGLREMIVANFGGRIIRVFENLVPGRSYRFSIAAVTPAGVGPAALSSWVSPSR
jgi:hypothetical protein